MACCLLCFSDDPVDDNEIDPKKRGRLRKGRNTFDKSLMDSNCTPLCLAGCCCPFCCAYYTRYKVLGDSLQNYTCCQGYANCCCFQAGKCGERDCPEFCLCLESCFCVGLSISTTRLYIMDQYAIKPDGCDNRLIRCVNCLICVSNICDILAIIFPVLQDCATILDCIADLAFYSMVGCMVSQVHRELEVRRKDKEVDPYQSAPIIAQVVTDEPVSGNYYQKKG